MTLRWKVSPSPFMPCCLLVAVAAAISGGQPVAADTLHVPSEFPSIQAAIDAALEGDTILVADGTYVGPGYKNLEFRRRSVTLKSENGPQSCIIDCQDEGRAFWINSQGAAEISISGFTMTRGFVYPDFPQAGRKGGALFLTASTAVFIDCIFEDNLGHTGGAIYMSAAATGTFINCRITNQVFEGGIGKADIHVGAGALVRNRSNATFINCTIADNICQPGPDHFGGGVYVQSGSLVTLINCILWGNDATEGDQIAVRSGGMVDVFYSDIEGGIDEVFIFDEGEVTFVEGNIDADPLFVDPTALDYGLAPGSPCIDAGDSTSVPAGTETDLAGDPRFVDDPDTPDTGLGDGEHPVVDMGAREFQIAVSCLADLDGDTAVGFGDLLILLAAWGPCPAGECPADLDKTGQVGFSDLVILLAAWGPC